MGAGRRAWGLSAVMLVIVSLRSGFLTVNPGAGPPGALGAGEGPRDSDYKCIVPRCDGDLWPIQEYYQCDRVPSHVFHASEIVPK